jgi:opacity protein-like surface antigen
MTKPVARAFGSLGTIAASLAPVLVTPQAMANPLNWSERQAPTPGLQWNTQAPEDAAGRSLTWQTVNPLDQLASDGNPRQPSGSTPAAAPATPDATAAEPDNPAQQRPWIIGIGGGARIGAGEPTYPMVYGRLGHMLNRDAALSLRPRYIFGNSNQLGRSNSEGAFQMPLTLDVKPTSWLSPYLGGGIATNTDSTGQTNGMLSLGADISISRNLAIDLGMNYIFQPNAIDSTNGDFEFTSVLYLRF